MMRLISGLMLSALASASMAQDAKTAATRAEDEQSSSPATVQSLGVRQRVEIIAGSDKEEATISIGKRIDRNVFNLSITTPIDKEKKQGTFANLDGLSDALRSKLTFTRQLRNVAAWPRNLEREQAICKQAGTARGFSDEKFAQGRADDSLPCDALTTPSVVDDALYGRSALTTDDKRTIAHELEPIRRNYLLASFDNHVWVPTLRGAVNVGTEEFSFLDAATSTKSEADETEWAVSLDVAALNILERLSIGVGYRRESVYEPNTKKTICTATAVAGQFDCETANIGGPVRKEKDLATLQFDLLRSNWAVTSLATYDFENDEYGVEVPVYLIRNEKSVWNGGVSFGWTSEERDFTVQIFVGVPFSFFD